MIRAFELAVRQLGDPKLRGIIWWSLLLSLLLQLGIAALAWWGLKSLAHFQWQWVNDAIVLLSGAGVIVLALMLFPASFGIVISIFMERIADIVEEEHYPQLGKARGIPITHEVPRSRLTERRPGPVPGRGSRRRGGRAWCPGSSRRR